jgi:hypothetical protein
LIFPAWILLASEALAGSSREPTMASWTLAGQDCHTMVTCLVPRREHRTVT